MKNNWGKIAIGTRLNDRCDPQFFNCWSRMLAVGMRLGDTLLDAGIELPQHFAATSLTVRFLKTDADTLFMVDTDMIFDPDQLSQLRDDKAGWQYDMLSGLSVTRRRPFYPIILRLQKNKKTRQWEYKCAKEKIDGKIIYVDAVGTGFTLIRRSVFENIQKKLKIKKWFFEFGLGGLGEDTQFCQRAKKVGSKIGVHTGINIGHRGPITFKWDYKTERTMMESYDQCKDLFAKDDK